MVLRDAGYASRMVLRDASCASRTGLRDPPRGLRRSPLAGRWQAKRPAARAEPRRPKTLGGESLCAQEAQVPGSGLELATFDGAPLTRDSRLLAGWPSFAQATNLPLSPTSDLGPPTSKLLPPALSSGFGSPVVPQLLLESRLAGKSTGVRRPDLEPLEPANHLECAHAKFAPATSLECVLANSWHLKFFTFRTYEKKGWGGLPDA